MKRSLDQKHVLPLRGEPQPRHPLGSEARVLLTSIFGPYAQDDEYGSRTINPMELYHNQVTREQGPFSLRLFHRSWGLMFIQANIDAPCTLLDFPTLDRFIEEIRTHSYDIIGISAIVPNLLKVKKMCELIRKYQPQAKIVVGGHVSNIPDLAARIDADHIVRGEGARWFREYLGEDGDRPLRHPQIVAGNGTRILGLKTPDRPEDMAATIIPSVGCPLGCNFCSTSAMFGGKGHSVQFYQTGDELFEIMQQLEANLGVQSFFMMDENFLLHRKRALRLLELMQKHDKAWALYVFSSAGALESYTMEQLVGLGLTWVWLGLEGKDSRYQKLHGTDPQALVRRFQDHGIRVMGSTIIGLENHTPENIDDVIDYAVQYDTVFHQFMLYTPLPGTPLHAELTAQGRMKDESEYDVADIHGQLVMNYRHPHIRNGQETEFLRRAFQRDFEVNGPSLMRMIRTQLAGLRRYRHHPEARIRRRFAWEARDLSTDYSAVMAAIRGYFRNNPTVREKADALLGELHKEFGLISRVFSLVGAPYVRWKLWRESRRLKAGWTYEPPTFYEQNASARETMPADAAQASRYVTCRTPVAVPAPAAAAAVCGVPGETVAEPVSPAALSG